MDGRVVYCFKQRTAYEVRISDWSSDVCSSDLRAQDRVEAGLQFLGQGGDLLRHIIDADHSRADEQAEDRHVQPARPPFQDRKSDVSGKSVSGRVDLGGSRILTKK